MPGLIRRTLLLGGVAAAAGGVALWRWRAPGDTELAYGSDPAQTLDIQNPRGGTAAPVLVMGFIAHYLQDLLLAGRATLPGWYLPLRLRLTSVAVVCLVAGLFSSGV